MRNELFEHAIFLSNTDLQAAIETPQVVATMVAKLTRKLHSLQAHIVRSRMSRRMMI